MDSSSVTPVTTDNGQYREKYTNKQLSTSTTRHKPSKGGWNAAFFIIFVEVADRFAFYGLAGNLIMYLTKVLGQPMATAAKNVNLWIGVSSLFPILGALVADSFLGRFKTILLSSVVYLMGMVMLSLSVSVIPSYYRKAVFFISLYVLSVGEGGHKPSVQTFAADQFNEDSSDEKEAKSSFFNWWYLGIVTGATAAMLLVIYIQDNISWTIGFGMLATVLAASLLLFLLGIKKYRRQSPVGSPITVVAQVFVAAARKWHVDGMRNSLGLYQGNEGVHAWPIVHSPLGARPLTHT
ncbi:Proton-dependent oligopeptide transporter family, partial [Parasponia andersonii]